MGDEGKGSIVDLVSDDADVVVRYQGGDNAGHTVSHAGKEFKLRLIPSGVVQGTLGVLGNGCAINLKTLFRELEELRDRGLAPRVLVSSRAHVVLPYHREFDLVEEGVKEEMNIEIGTTGNGIGPTFEDKAARRGIRIADLSQPDALRQRLEFAVSQNQIPEGVDRRNISAEAFDVDSLYRMLRDFGERLADREMVIETGSFLTEEANRGQVILFEGAQGTHIDLDHGSYPYVTSSTPTAGGAIVGTGVGPTMISDGAIVGVVKAYLTRVGRGPMPTEMDEEVASTIRVNEEEVGTVTGRPRRIGWLDLPMLRHAKQVNGFTGIALNHVDALAGLDEIRICEAYDYEGQTRYRPPPTTAMWDQCKPQYTIVDSWPEQDWSHVASQGYDTLSENSREYIERVSDALDLPVYSVGVGPEREDTIVLHNPFEVAG